MNNAPALLRSLIIYALCVPLAVFIGYLLTNPLDTSTFSYVGILAMLLVFPLLLRGHYALMLLFWNTNACVFFMKGRPALGLITVMISLGLSVLERTLNSRKQFIRVPQITWPLICLVGVVILTAKLTGGIGLRSFGSDVYGGRKYIWLIAGILSYFALTAQRIPPEKVKLYLGLVYLGGATCLIGDLYSITPSFLRFIYFIFPPSSNYNAQFEVGMTRLGGFGVAGVFVYCWLLARYGIRGVFLSGKLWRVAVFILCFVMTFLGGYRSALMEFGLVFVLMFFLEGLHRTRLMPRFVLLGVLGMGLALPLASHLPFTFQRTLAFLPLNLSQEAKGAADASSEWRLEMWKALLPQVPQHLLLGKGYAFSVVDFQSSGSDTAFHTIDAAQQGSALASDFHNGPLSVILPFGIWGAIAFLWLLLAGTRVLYYNFRYGDPSLRTINAFLLASFIVRLLIFMTVFGALETDIAKFGLCVGFSVALNGGVCQPAPRPVPTQEEPLTLPRPFLRPRPVFQRYRSGL